MNSQDLTTLIADNKLDILKSSLEVSKYAYFISDSLGLTGYLRSSNNLTPEVKALREYHPKSHDIFDPQKRKDKTIKGDDGDARNGTVVPVNRIPLAEQKKIVMLAAAFLGSPELSCTPKPGIETDFLNSIVSISDDNKLDFKSKDIYKRTMSERECAEIWYTEPVGADYWEGTPLQGLLFKLRVRIISPSLGDTLYPVYDNYGDMIAFGRYYEMIEDDLTTGKAGEKVAHFDVYTKERFYYATKTNSGQWEFNYEPVVGPDGKATETYSTNKGIPNLIGKIPVIYYSQSCTEWEDVQDSINRLETIFSNHGDTNDYSGSPIVFAEGDVKGFADKGEQGKVLIGENGAKVSYLEYKGAPESIKMEIENLKNAINTYTHTPNISFDNIKGLGVFSGIALKMFFMDAHLKASDKEEIFGEGIQRRINYLKHSVSVLNGKFKVALRLVIKPKFTYFLPKNEAEEIDNIIKCVNAGIMSIETAVKLCPLIQDHVSELVLIQKEKEAKAKLLPPPNLPNPGNPVA